jgi:cobalt/nickel transport system ATP-binding protein
MRPATHDTHRAAARPAGDAARPLALEVEGLAFAYPDGSEALSGIDLRVAAGERVAVLGPNGAGKTTLALHLNGIHRAAQGRVTVAGTTLEDRTLAELRRRVGLVFQDPDDQLFMPTVREDIGFGPANLGLRGDELRTAWRGRWPPSGARRWPTGHPTTSRVVSDAGSRSRRCWRWSPT